MSRELNSLNVPLDGSPPTIDVIVDFLINSGPTDSLCSKKMVPCGHFFFKFWGVMSISESFRAPFVLKECGDISFSDRLKIDF